LDWISKIVNGERFEYTVEKGGIETSRAADYPLASTTKVLTV